MPADAKALYHFREALGPALASLRAVCEAHGAVMSVDYLRTIPSRKARVVVEVKLPLQPRESANGKPPK